MKKKYLFIGNAKSPLALYRHEFISELLNEKVAFYDRSEMKLILKSGERKKLNISYTKKLMVYFRLDHLFALAQVFIYIIFNRVEIVFFHGVSRQLLCLIPIITKSKAIAIPQGSDINQQFKGIHRYFTKMLLSEASMIFVKSNPMQERVQKLCASKNIRVINWGVNPAFEECANAVKSIKRPDCFTVTSLRSFKPLYNIQVIFQAISELKAEGIPLRFIFVSLVEPSNFTELPDCIDEMYFSMPTEELRNLLESTDVTVSVPTYDGFSTTIVESLMVGVYPLISDIPAYAKEFDDPMVCMKIKDINVSSIKSALRDAFINLSDIRSTKKYRMQYAINKYSAASQRIKILEALESL